MTENKISTQFIGPNQAEAMLSTNVSNRDLSQSFVNRYAADMSKGNWAQNSSMIRIDSNGNLQDGQHRLAAVKQSGTTQAFVVVENCSVEDFKFLDLGRGRSSRDALTVLGYKKPKIMSAAIRLVCLYNDGKLTKATVNRVSTDTKMQNVSTGLTKSETIEQTIQYAAKHPMVNPLVERAATIQKSFRIVPSAVFGCFLFKANELGDTTLEFATEFLKEFADCTGKPGTATHSLFVRVVQQSKSGVHFSQSNRLAMMVVAWNAWIHGKPRVQITVKGGVPMMESADV